MTSATKLLVVTTTERGPDYAMFYCAPNRSSPVDGAVVVARKGFPLECGRHGTDCECIDAVRKHARAEERDAGVARLVCQSAESDFDAEC